MDARRRPGETEAGSVLFQPRLLLLLLQQRHECPEHPADPADRYIITARVQRRCCTAPPSSSSSSSPSPLNTGSISDSRQEVFKGGEKRQKSQNPSGKLEVPAPPWPHGGLTAHTHTHTQFICTSGSSWRAPNTPRSTFPGGASKHRYTPVKRARLKTSWPTHPKEPSCSPASRWRRVS